MQSYEPEIRQPLGCSAQHIIQVWNVDIPLQDENEETHHNPAQSYGIGQDQKGLEVPGFAEEVECCHEHNGPKAVEVDTGDVACSPRTFRLGNVEARNGLSREQQQEEPGGRGEGCPGRDSGLSRDRISVTVGPWLGYLYSGIGFFPF